MSSGPENPSNYRRLGGNWREMDATIGLFGRKQQLLSIVSQE
jgi:hypothetical protein